MHPRPILKRSSSSSSSSSGSEKHAVHFPPSPALTRTFVAHSPAAYDRSPIVVVPNVCALPERGGRTYVLDDQSSRRRSMSKSGRVLHPRAMGDCPSLIPDLSSESDDSDVFPSPHLENHEFYFGLKAVQQPDDAANLLSFLPYAPSNPYQQPDEEDAQEYLDNSPRRRKEHKRTTLLVEEQGEEIISPPPRRRSRSRSKIPCKEPSYSFPLSDSFSSFALRDDGCLGGF